MKEDNTHASASELLLIEPANSREWEEYFHLRWTVLRQPWNQPRGSERDERENDSVHLMIYDTEHHPIATGRLHFNSPMEAQIRFMAVTPRWRHSGLGSRILRALERRAKAADAARNVPTALRNSAASIWPPEPSAESSRGCRRSGGVSIPR